jgi:NAD(P)H-flavin reductase
MNKWGGVTMAYRKLLIDSPAYRLNHEEIREALKQGINIFEGISPVEAVPDENGAVKELIFAKQNVTKDAETGRTRYKDSEDLITIPAKTILVAAGTSPNIVYEREHPGTFLLDEKGYFFREHKIVKDENGKHVLVEAKENETGLFTSYEKNGKFISYYGDNHPDYAGNVVKAMASAHDGYEIVARLFSDEIKSLQYDKESVQEREKKFSEIVHHLDEVFTATVHSVERLTPTIVEITVHAPYAAKKFRPGQFYRLQNYELTAPIVNGAKLTTEGMAMTGAWTDPEKGLLSLIVLEMGVSSRLTELLQKGEKVVVMGPTGEPTHIPENQTVLLAGGGLGNAVLFSIAEALRRRNNKVIYFAGYKDSKDVFKMDEVEAGADQVIWSNDTGEMIMPRRAQDLSFKGNIVEAMRAYSEGMLGNALGDFKEVRRIITIGSDRMMNAVKAARYTVFKDKFGEHTGIGSINSPMQCMMKEICAQCLQRHVDPVTGKESFVFTCFNQDQDLDRVDFENLHQRLKQNSVLEKLANAYLTFLFSKGEEELSNVEDDDSIMKGH